MVMGGGRNRGVLTRGQATPQAVMELAVLGTASEGSTGSLTATTSETSETSETAEHPRTTEGQDR